jgi:deoxyinosine 3'endonuclease (endonuclease V)
MTVRDLPPWDVTPKEADAIQKELTTQLSARSSARRIQTVASVDLRFPACRSWRSPRLLFLFT